MAFMIFFVVATLASLRLSIFVVGMGFSNAEFLMLNA